MLFQVYYSYFLTVYVLVSSHPYSNFTFFFFCNFLEKQREIDFEGGKKA